jgi:hypothetical protein
MKCMSIALKSRDAAIVKTSDLNNQISVSYEYGHAEYHKSLQASPCRRLPTAS